MIALFPGSFKPPHIGHYNVILELLKMGVESIHIIISAKPRDNITAQQSKEIWEIYKQNIKDGNKLNISISPHLSPIQTVYFMSKKEPNNIILVKSNKNANGRFNKFDSIKSISIKSNHNISATDMRQYIRLRNKNNTLKYLPNSLPQKDIKKIFKILGL